MIEEQNKPVIIIDLDGTVYDSTPRSHHIQAGNWDAFHEDSIHDLPHPDVVLLLKRLNLSMNGEGVFIAITGRNERYRHITLEWLNLWMVPVDSLWMRPDDNFQKDVEVKMALLDEALEYHKLTRDHIWFAIDDRDKMIDAYREAGINAYQVKPSTY